jgi:lysyl-tRNA synthetase class 2
MLEWYRTGMDLNALVHDTCALVSDVTGLARGQQYSWYQLMQDCLGCHPDRATEGDFKCVLDAAGMTYPALVQKSDWFDLVFSHLVQPRLGMGEDGQPCLDVVIGYPVEMASLAKLAPAGSDEWVALRFEAYLGGMEIANGYEELTDPVEQRRRFEADNAARARLGLGARPVDHRLLAALEAGLPDCAGVALGLDRLLLCSLGLEALDQVLLFPAEIA